MTPLNIGTVLSHPSFLYLFAKYGDLVLQAGLSEFYDVIINSVDIIIFINDLEEIRTPDSSVTD